MISFKNTITVIDCDYIKKRNSSAESGIYTIRPLKNDTTEMEVYCDMEGQNGWIVCYFFLKI